jgi:hypothetical protein
LAGGQDGAPEAFRIVIAGIERYPGDLREGVALEPLAHQGSFAKAGRSNQHGHFVSMAVIETGKQLLSFKKL